MTAVLADRRELTRSLSAFAAFQQGHFYLPSPHNCTRVEGGAGLAELSDASHFHDRRFLLPLCKTGGLVVIRVPSNKGFAVLVKQSHLPVIVFSTLVFSVCCEFPSFHLRNTVEEVFSVLFILGFQFNYGGVQR
jgi:hypothetical protein